LQLNYYHLFLILPCPHHSVAHKCVKVLLQVGPCGEVRAYIMALWGVHDLSPTCGDLHKE